MAKHNTAIILLAVLLSLTAGTAYLLLAPSRYIASATLLVNPAVSSMPEEYYIEAQTQMMRSDAVARAVVEQLDLVEAGIGQDDGAFLRDRIREVRRFVDWLVPALAPAPDDGDPVQAAILTLRRNLTVARPAMTPVISISYNSTAPNRAADVVNTLVQAYASHRRRSETAAAEQSVEWLIQHLEKLQLQLAAAEHAVEEFKITNNIVGTGTSQNLRAEQRLYELSVQLDASRAATAQARGRYESMQGGGEDLRKEQRPAPERQPAALHPGVIPANERPNPDIRAAEEREGAVEAYRNDLDSAVRRQALLEHALAEAVQRAKQVNQHRIRLAELEASVETYRGLYGNMRQRYEEAAQRQGALPANDGVQVLIAAPRPQNRSQPRPLLVFAFAGAFGLAFGIGAAAVRERLLGVDS